MRTAFQQEHDSRAGRIYPRGQITEIPAEEVVEEEEGQIFYYDRVGEAGAVAPEAAHASPVVCAVSAAEDEDFVLDQNAKF